MRNQSYAMRNQSYAINHHSNYEIVLNLSPEKAFPLRTKKRQESLEPYRYEGRAVVGYGYIRDAELEGKCWAHPFITISF